MIEIDMTGCTVDQILTAVKHADNMNANEAVYLVGEPVNSTAAEVRRFMNLINSKVSGAVQ